MAYSDYFKTRTITLQKKDIFFDVDALSLSYGEVSGGGDPVRVNAMSSETATTNGTRTFTRFADRRVDELKDLLRKYIASTTDTAGINTIDSSDYAISLSVPTEFPDNVLDTVARLMHDYVVKGSLADWYADIGAGASESLAARAKESYDRIRELVYFRPYPTA